MITIPGDVGPQAELAVRRAWDFAMGRMMAADAPMSTVKIFLVVFELRHHLRYRLPKGETFTQLAAAAGISEDSASRAVAWLKAHDFIFFGRNAAQRLGSPIMLRPLYLANVQDTFKRKTYPQSYPQSVHNRQHPRTDAGNGHYKTFLAVPARKTVGTIGDPAASGRFFSVDKRQTAARNPTATPTTEKRLSPWKIATGRTLAMGVLASLAPPGHA